MNIQYIKTNIEKLNQQQLVSLLADMILDVVDNIKEFDSTKIYDVGDKVYFEEDGGVHHVYQCIVKNTTTGFIRENWLNLIEVYKGDYAPFYDIRILEEVVKPTSKLTKHTISLDYNADQSTVAIYKGKLRLVRDDDFTLNGKTITLKTALNAGERIIIEVRERLGVIPNVYIGLVLYDLDGNPYNVIIDDNGVVTIKLINRKDAIRDTKRGIILYGDKLYSLMIDNTVNPVALRLYEEVTPYIKATDGKIYGVTVVNTMYTLKEAKTVYDGVEVILGTDKKLYNFKVSNNIITPVICTDSTLSADDFTLGLKLKNTDAEPVMIDVKSSKVRVVKYRPNIACENILMKSTDGTIYRITLNPELGMHLHDDTSYENSASTVVDAVYFYDYDWNNWKLYMEKDRLIYENTSEVEVRDSKGINMITEDGMLCKFMLVVDTKWGGLKPDVIKFVDFSRAGTFKAPLDSLVLKKDAETAKKMLSVNIAGKAIKLEDTDVDTNYRSNDYIYGSDNKLYKLDYSGNSVSVIECDKNEFIMENKRNKLVLKSNEVINVIDINNSKVVIDPVSTFKHTLQSTDGRYYVLDITGDKGNEVISFDEINSNHVYYNNVGVGALYLKNDSDVCYTGIVNSSTQTLQYSKDVYDEIIDYDISSVAYTTTGWYKFDLTGTILSIRKIFNNIYYPSLCYQFAREFTMESENKKKFSITANGNAEVVINPILYLDDRGVYLSSDDGGHYALAVKDYSIVTYRVEPDKEIYSEPYILMYDNTTGRGSKIYMDGPELIVEAATDYQNSELKEELILYDDEGNNYNVSCYNNELKLNGESDLLLSPMSYIQVKGVFLRSDDDNCYCIGCLNNSLVTYRSYIEKDVIIKKVIYMKDIITGKCVMIYMKDDQMIIETVTTDYSDAIRELIVYDEYDNESIVYYANGSLMLVTDLLYNVLDKSNNKYSIDISKKQMSFNKTTSAKTSGYIKLTDLSTNKHYNGFINADGVLEFEVTNTAHKSFTQAVMTESGEVYILSMNEGRVSMALMSNDNIVKPMSVDEDLDYVPQTLNSKLIYDNIRLYTDIINTEGYALVNSYELLNNNELSDEIDEDKLICYIPTITKHRPRVTILGDISEGDEEDDE